MYICVDVGARVQPGGDGGGAGADQMSACETRMGGKVAVIVRIGRQCRRARVCESERECECE